MLLQLIFATTLITVVRTQDNSKPQNDEAKQDQEVKSPVVYLERPNHKVPHQNEIQSQENFQEFYAGQPYSPELYRWTYGTPQYQAEGPLQRLQPQIVLYGPGGQGQPILINPGNPPGNFLIPQGPGPNVIVRNNPLSPQGPLFPVAGYPKPAHIPPIEKDAEEIPTNPSRIPPLSSEANPVTKPKNKPEKLETFNEPNQPDSNINPNKEEFPQSNSETINSQPEQRFYVLNGDPIFSYPFGTQSQIQHNLPAFRYTNMQPFPQNPPKFLQAFGQEPSQISQEGQEKTIPIPISSLPQHNSFINSQQIESQRQQNESQPRYPNPSEDEGTTKIAQQYFQAAYPVNLPQFYLHPEEYPASQQEAVANGPFNQNIQEIQVERISPKNDIVQPQVVGQFKFTPSVVPGIFSFKDDFENDAIVVDASFDENNNFDARGGSLKAESETTTSKPVQPTEHESSMAQAAPQATAIAGPGGVAGSAPRGTAIVGKGGLAVSSPQATAVAGTKDEKKNKTPVKKQI